MFAQQKPGPGAYVNPLHPLGKGIIGAWLFNERSGTRANDWGPYGLHGPITGATWTVDNQGNSALAFGGSGYIVIPDMSGIRLLGSAGCSGASYLRRGAIGAAHQIFATSIGSTSAKASSSISGANVLTAGGRAASGDTYQAKTSTATFTDTARWMLFSWLIDIGNDNIRMWIDGVEQATAGSPSWATDAFAVNVGARATIGSAPNLGTGFNGDLSWVYFWNRMLSSEEMALLYARPYAMFGRRS